MKTRVWWGHLRTVSVGQSPRGVVFFKDPSGRTGRWMGAGTCRNRIRNAQDQNKLREKIKKKEEEEKEEEDEEEGGRNNNKKKKKKERRRERRKEKRRRRRGKERKDFNKFRGKKAQSNSESSISHHDFLECPFCGAY